MVKSQKKTKALILFLMLVLVAFLFIPVGEVLAETLTLTDFDRTNVIDDLTSMSDFKVSNYPKKESGKTQLVSFVEYCYSEDKSITDKYYGLYLYVYFPKSAAILSVGNTATMATGFDQNAKAVDFEKKKLQLIAKSDDNIFYKFIILDSKSFLKRTEVNLTQRRYEIASIELNVKPIDGKAYLEDFGCGGNYVFTGYSKGCGTDLNADSTIKCAYSSTEVLNIKAYDSTYRTGESDVGRGHRNQVTSIAFSVPNSFFEKYGRLQKIKAEWWEYRTEPVVVVNDKKVYDSVYSVRDIELDGDNESLQLSPYGFSSEGNDGYPFLYNWQRTVGSTLKLTHLTLPNIFYSSGSLKNHYLSSDLLKNHLISYPVSDDRYFETRGKKISKRVVNENVGAGRKAGYNKVNIDGGDTFDLKSYENGNIGSWARFWAMLTGSNQHIEYDFVKNISPIYVIKDNVLLGDNVTLSRELLWQEDKISWLKGFNVQNQNADMSTVVFRVGVSDYYSAQLSTQGKISNEGYVAEENIFVDLDVIQLTFSENGVYTPIAVAMNPIDIVGAIEAPMDFVEGVWSKLKELLKWGGIALACVIGLVLLIAFFPLIVSLIKAVVKVLWWVVKTPFILIYKGFAWLFGAIKR